jgi:hypothetical protein
MLLFEKSTGGNFLTLRVQWEMRCAEFWFLQNETENKIMHSKEGVSSDAEP